MWVVKSHMVGLARVLANANKILLGWAFPRQTFLFMCLWLLLAIFIFIPLSNYLCYAVKFLTTGTKARYWLQRDSLMRGVYSAWWDQCSLYFTDLGLKIMVEESYAEEPQGECAEDSACQGSPVLESTRFSLGSQLERFDRSFWENQIERGWIRITTTINKKK